MPCPRRGSSRRGLFHDGIRSWTFATGLVCTARTSSGWRASASRCRTCRSTWASRASRTGPSASSRRWPPWRGWPSSRSASGRIGWAGASPSWSSRWRRSPPRPGSFARPTGSYGSGSSSPCSPRTASAGRFVESLAGAEAAALAPEGKVGSALGALRFWKPIGIVLMTLFGGWMAETRGGVASILLPLCVVQGLAVAASLLIHDSGGLDRPARDVRGGEPAGPRPATPRGGWLPKDAIPRAASRPGDGSRRTPGCGRSRRRWSFITRPTRRAASTWGSISSATCTHPIGCWLMRSP